MDIAQMLELLNVWDKFGSVTILDGEDRKGCGYDDLRDGDIVVFYDWVEDDMTPEEEDRFEAWLDTYFTCMGKVLFDNGYHEVHHNDGSGNGLTYGCVVYRK